MNIDRTSDAAYHYDVIVTPDRPKCFHAQLLINDGGYTCYLAKCLLEKYEYEYKHETEVVDSRSRQKQFEIQIKEMGIKLANRFPSLSSCKIVPCSGVVKETKQKDYEGCLASILFANKYSIV
uniref:Uncharacterized protein n=1 Tax=Glossina austeni TaxID=7395 RepID=A0A1A9UZH6_GLOAU